MALTNDISLIKNIMDRVRDESKLKLAKTIKATSKDVDWFVQFGMKNDINNIKSPLIFNINGKDLEQHFEILKDRKNDKYYVMVHFESNDFSLPSIIEETIKFFCSKNGLVEYLGKQWSNTSKKEEKWGWFAFLNSNTTTQIKESTEQIKKSTESLDELVSFRGTSSTLVEDITKELLKLYEVFNI